MLWRGVKGLGGGRGGLASPRNVDAMETIERGFRRKPGNEVLTSRLR